MRARDVVIRLGDADDVCIMRGEDRFQSTPHALAILHAFAHPRTIAEVLAESAHGAQHFIELSSTVMQLAAAGILRPPGLADPAPHGFARPTIHVVMLDDEPRTRGYIRALEAVMKPDNTPYLYFVSKNDGTHYFSKTEKEHEAAVDKYQRGK